MSLNNQNVNFYRFSLIYFDKNKPIFNMNLTKNLLKIGIGVRSNLPPIFLSLFHQLYVKKQVIILKSYLFKEAIFRKVLHCIGKLDFKLLFTWHLKLTGWIIE